MKYLGGIVVALLVGARALAEEVSGQVLLPGGRPAANAVVFLEGAEKSRPLRDVVIDQRNRTFIPHVRVVTVGTPVRFPNNDTLFHNVFASYEAKRFDLGMYPRGASRTVRFEKKGVVALLCNVHSEMSAYLYVVDTPYYATTDASGRFRLSGVPPAAYRLRGWHESGATYESAWTLASGGAAVTVRLERR